MPGFPTRASIEDRERTKAELIAFSKTFAIACAPASDLIPLLARGEREQAAVARTATAKAAQPGARRPLPRAAEPLSSATKSLAASPIFEHLSMKVNST